MSRWIVPEIMKMRRPLRCITVDVGTLVQAFICSRLDYCNCLLHGQPDTLLCKLQSVHEWRTTHEDATIDQAPVTPVTLISTSTSHQVQGCVPSPPVIVRTSTCLPRWRLQARVWDWSTCSAVSQCHDMYGAADPKQLRWRVLPSQAGACGTTFSATWIQ